MFGLWSQIMYSLSSESLLNALMQFVMSSSWNHLLNSSIKSDSVTFSKSEKFKVGIDVVLAVSFGIGQNSTEHFDKTCVVKISRKNG